MRCKPAIWLLVAALTGGTAGIALADEGADMAMQAGIKNEVVDGDLPGAIKIFELVTRLVHGTELIQPHFHLGRCYEKLGETQAAVREYENVVNVAASSPPKTAGDKGALQEAWKRLIARTETQPKAAAGGVGWYNGDWQSGIPGLSNWYRSQEDFARVYDDFVVPAGGWTVTTVFSDNRMDFTGVTSASWEIRRGIGPGQGGSVVASGMTRATQTVIHGNGPFPKDPMVGYRIQVDGLIVKLAPGRYWLSVAPVGTGKSYVNATKGRNAFGEPRGNNGQAFYSHPESKAFFVEAERIGRGGQLGIGTDFSQGLMIANPIK